VKAYNFDGADISFQDTYPFTMGTGEQWLVSFTNRLRELLPSPMLIVHTTPAAHFKS